MILLISPKHDMLIAAIPFVYSGPAVRRHLFYFVSSPATVSKMVRILSI